MNASEIKKTDSKELICEHDEHEDARGGHLSLGIRWILVVCIVSLLLFSLKSFIINLMLSRVNSYFSSYDFDDAIRMSKKVIFIDKNNVDGWDSLADAYKEKAVMDKTTGNSTQEKVDIDTSIKAYEKAISLAPKHIESYFEAGMLYFARKDFAKAAYFFESAYNIAQDRDTQKQTDFTDYHNRSLAMLQNCRRSWKYYGTDSKGNLNYYSIKSINKSFDTITAWTYTKPTDHYRKDMIELGEKLNSPEIGEEHQTYDHDNTLYEIDCKNKKFRMTAMIEFDSKGTIINSYEYMDIPWISIDSQDITFGKLFNKICVTQEKTVKK
jgi:tetratricopeptide (TPR) repeat protein